MIPITFIIIGITSIVSFLAFNNRELLNKFMFNAFQIAHRKEYWRMLSNGLIHGGTMHLVINMFVLYMFGMHVELAFLHYFETNYILYFLLLYIGAIIISSIPSLRKHKDNPGYNALGASGATSAIMFSSIVMDPTNTLYLFFAIPMPAFVAGIGFLYYESYMGKRGGTGIAHDAHFGGAIFGILLTILLRPSFAMEFVQKIIAYIESGLSYIQGIF